MQPILRRVITRSIGLVPSMAVAIAAGRNGVDTLLVASQVALSIVLPFIIFPLLYLTSSKSIMSVKKAPTGLEDQHELTATAEAPAASESANADSASRNDTTPARDLEDAVEYVDYSNPKIVTVLGWLLWLVVVAANVYAIVSLGLGQE